MRNITILLIGDNPEDLRLIREMLKDISYFKSNLISAETLKAGCEQAQKNNFDIILLDLNPGPIVQQTFQKVIDCCKEIPVILITANEDEKLALKLIKEGAQDYIPKQRLNPVLLGKSILYSIERLALLRDIKKQNVQIGRNEKERIILAKIPSENRALILRVAGNGKLLYINEAGIKLLPDWKLILNGFIPSRLKDIIDPILIDGTTIEFELCHRELIYSFYAVPFIEEGYINLYGRDITARRQAEEALRESEEKHRTIIQTSIEGFWLVDMQGSLLEVNETYCRMSGYSSLELLTMCISDLEAVETTETTAAHIQKISSRGGDRFDSRHRRKDGSIFDVEVRAQYQFVEYGWFVVFIQDISERKRMEKALVKLKKAIYTSGEAIFLTDREGVFTFVNPAFSSLYGFSSDELIGKATPRIINSGVLDKSIYKIFWKTLLNGNEVRGEMINKRKDGTLINIDGSATPIIDEEKKIIGFLGIQRNITERKRAEKELIEKEYFLKESQRAGNIGSYKVNFVTGYWQSSETLDSIFGIDKNHDRSIAGWLEIVHPDDRQNMDKYLRLEVIGKRKLFNKEYRIVRNDDKKTKWVWGHGDLKYDDSGNIVEMIGTITDITGKKYAELERVKLTVDLIQRNKDLEQFTYIVSHNLRAPVANILGATSLLSNPELSTKEKDVLNRGLYESVDRLDSVVKDLNQILQIKSKINEIKEEVSFSDLVEDIKISIQDLTGNDRIKIEYDFFEIDNFLTLKSYFYSIFYNLISNSFKYRQPDIPLVIEIKSRKLKDKMELIFKDNGRGMDLEKVGDKVFGLYKRFHSENIEGKGIGLYMVKTQVESLGGKISISSKVNQGAEFKIEFKI